MSQNDQYLIKAKNLVSEDVNLTFQQDPNRDLTKPLTKGDDFYIVWFAKTLGNWKALVSTDLMSGQYWEVTHDGGKNQTYVDHYMKRTNNAYSDAGYDRRFPQSA